MDNPHLPLILLASRDQQLAYLLQRYAGNCDCQMLQAEYGASLMRAIAQNRPNVILLDVSQTNAEGRLALRELKSQSGTRFIPVILCATSETDWLDCEAEGRLLQPILFSEFVSAVAETGIQTPKNSKEV
jgi:CheY-like chemotaxis protein